MPEMSKELEYMEEVCYKYFLDDTYRHTFDRWKGSVRVTYVHFYSTYLFQLMKVGFILDLEPITMLPTHSIDLFNERIDNFILLDLKEEGLTIESGIGDCRRII